jgi:hypothetical protein
MYEEVLSVGCNSVGDSQFFYLRMGPDPVSETSHSCLNEIQKPSRSKIHKLRKEEVLGQIGLHCLPGRYNLRRSCRIIEKLCPFYW